MESKLRVNSKTKMIGLYLLSSGIFLIMVLNKGIVEDASIGFYIGLILVIVLNKSFYSILLYFLIIALNMYMLYIPLKFVNGKTVTAVLYLYSIIFLAAMLFKHRFYLNQRTNKFVFSLILFMVLSVILYSGISYIDGTSVIEIVWKLSPLYMSIALSLYIADKPFKVDELMIAIICAAVLFTIVAYVELINGKTYFYRLWAGDRYRNGILRVGSTLGDPNTLAMYLVPVCFLTRTSKCKNIFGKRVSLVLFLLMQVMVVLSSSRTSLLALLFGYIIWCWLNGQLKTQIIALLTVIFALGIMPYAFTLFYNYDVASSGQRIMLVLKAISIWTEHPFTGIGFDQFQKLTFWMTMNEYAKQLVEFGIFGFILYISCYVTLFIPMAKGLKRLKSENRKDGAYMMAALAAFAFNSLSMDSYFHYIMWIFPPLYMSFYRENIMRPKI